MSYFLIATGKVVVISWVAQKLNKMSIVFLERLADKKYTDLFLFNYPNYIS